MNANPESRDQYVPLRGGAFADTSFLMHLLKVERRAPKDGKPADDILTRQRRAESRFQEVTQRAKAKLYWSPVVFHELIYTVAKAILTQRNLREEFGVKNEAEEICKADGFRGIVPPEFIARVLPDIRKKLQGFLEHFNEADDVWRTKDGVSLDDVMDWEKLTPADCVIAVAAAKSGAGAIIADDKHFREASSLLAEKLQLQLVDIGEGLGKSEASV